MTLRRILLLVIWIYAYCRWPATSTQLMKVVAVALAVYLALNLAMKLNQAHSETRLVHLKDLPIGTE
jgi:hypothetical protein